jgi:transcriptional regulator with XRE-family HTH domain
MENLGAWLLNKLKEKKITQSDLAKRSGLSEGTISNIISGSRGTGLDSVEALARGLRVPAEEVFLAAIGRPMKPHDEWVKEMTEKIDSLPPNMRAIVEDFVETVVRKNENK